MVTRYISALFLLLIPPCSCTFENEKLTFAKVENNSKRLNIDGCFLYLYSVGDTKHCVPVFLYRNGVIVEFGSMELERLHERLNDEEFLAYVKTIRSAWGLYRINEDSISYEKWYYSGGPPKITYIRKGKILNDSTFIITSSERPNGDERTELNEVYRFKKFHPKPDSTNDFIK
jgi:hypothetical protein